jgi:hypothetical protein
MASIEQELPVYSTRRVYLQEQEASAKAIQISVFVLYEYYDCTKRGSRPKMIAVFNSYNDAKLYAEWYTDKINGRTVRDEEYEEDEYEEDEDEEVDEDEDEDELWMSNPAFKESFDNSGDYWDVVKDPENFYREDHRVYVSNEFSESSKWMSIEKCEMPLLK